MRGHLEVTDTNGRTWVSDSDEITEQQEKSMNDVFDNGLAELNNLSMHINGRSLHFNTAHVVTAALVADTP